MSDDQMKNEKGEWVDAEYMECPSWLSVQWEAITIWFKETFTDYVED